MADMLAKRGIELVDTDVIARQLTAGGGKALPEIVAAFGEQVIDSSGALDRALMAQMVFRDPLKRQKLESILHPLIREDWRGRVVAFRERPSAHLIVVIPLLFETAAEGEFDQLICVACSHKDQKQRLADRGWSVEHANDRIRSQWPVERKMARCDLVLWTSCSLELCQRQIEGMLVGLEGRSLGDG